MGLDVIDASCGHDAASGKPRFEFWICNIDVKARRGRDRL